MYNYLFATFIRSTVLQRSLHFFNVKYNWLSMFDSGCNFYWTNNAWKVVYLLSGFQNLDLNNGNLPIFGSPRRRRNSFDVPYSPETLRINRTVYITRRNKDQSRLKRNVVSLIKRGQCRVRFIDQLLRRLFKTRDLTRP